MTAIAHFGNDPPPLAPCTPGAAAPPVGEAPAEPEPEPGEGVSVAESPVVRVASADNDEATDLDEAAARAEDEDMDATIESANVVSDIPQVMSVPFNKQQKRGMQGMLLTDGSEGRLGYSAVV